jgi:hypothetical protein
VQQVGLVKDEGAVEEFGSAGSDPAFHDRIRPRATGAGGCGGGTVQQCLSPGSCADGSWARRHRPAGRCVWGKYWRINPRSSGNLPPLTRHHTRRTVPARTPAPDWVMV